MLKGYSFWLWTAVGVMFLTVAIHTTSLFVKPTPQNETGQQLAELMNSYRFDSGAGFQPSMKSLLTAASSCFSLLCLLGGLLNGYFLKKKVDSSLIRGVVAIDLLVFCICFGVMLVFTFLTPIVLTGLIVLFLIVAFLTVPGKNVSEVLSLIGQETSVDAVETEANSKG